ncbi:MAG: sodium:alanine symporter family protein, partial [Gemmatimonadetes bacterium]|nr:sodium:alanine symporter family protein [Gemmatimonadota bacterium]
SYVVLQENGRYGGADAPAEIALTQGVQSVDAVGAVLVAWHETPVEQLFVDEAQTVPFTGTIVPAVSGTPGRAVAADGTVYTSLFGDAAESGAPLTAMAFGEGLPGTFGQFIVVTSVLLFAVSTAISWSYYGDRCANYLFGPGAIRPYKAVFVAMHFVGAVAPLAVVWSLGDVALAIVIVPNLIALLLLSGQVREETRSYFARKPWEKQPKKP